MKRTASGPMHGDRPAQWGMGSVGAAVAHFGTDEEPA